MKRFVLTLLAVLCASNLFAQTTVVRPQTFRNGIQIFPGVRPASPDEGTIYQDSVTHVLYIYTGSVWQPVGAVSVSALTGSVTIDGAHGTTGQVFTSQGTGSSVWSDVSVIGAGSAQGATNTLQYNGGSGNFASAATWKYLGANALVSTGTGRWIYNTPTEGSAGAFELNIGVASNDIFPGDTRPDHVANIGWNGSASASGPTGNGTNITSSQLTFESYCSYGTGCFGGNGGQSETYFAMSDGNGSGVRPLGFFQRISGTPTEHNLSVIARSDQWGFWDRDQTHNIFSIDYSVDNDIGTIRAFDSVLNFNAEEDKTFINLNGNAALGIGTNGIEVGRGGSVDLAPGGDGSSYVLASGFQFRVSPGTISDASGNPRFALGAGSLTNYGSIGGAGVNEVIVKPLGSTSDILLTLQSQGNANVRMNPTGTGRSELGNHVRSTGNTPSVAGTTSNACGTTSPTIAGTDVAGRITVGATSGTSCTVTFAADWVVQQPVCMGNNETSGGVVKTTPSGSTTMIFAGTFTAGDKISYMCITY